MHELLFAIATLFILLVIWSWIKKPAPAPAPVLDPGTLVPIGTDPNSEKFSPADTWRIASNQIAPTFSNTLQRRFGMDSAGASGKEPFGTQSCIGTFDCMKENYRSSGDIAANTMMAGFQNASTLPL